MFKRLFSRFLKSDKNSDNRPLILVIEDNPVDSKIICAILKKEYRIERADNGYAGFIKAQTIHPDVILMDCEMPRMNGLEACRELKSNAVTQKIPVIFLTSVKTSHMILECFNADAENYLSKPISAKVLKSQIIEILKEAQTENKSLVSGVDNV